MQFADQIPANDEQAVSTHTTIGGDNVGQNKTEAGDIHGNFNVVGPGQLTVNNNTTNIIQSAPKEEKPRHPYEPEMALVAAGNFLMGSDQHKPAEAPQHQVLLSDYHIAIYPVTNQDYGRFVQDTKYPVSPSLLWHGNIPPKDEWNSPVAGVSWYDALAYCEWLTKLTGRHYTLPSEAQWEKAARGENGRFYPWGDSWQAERCNSNPQAIVPVDKYPAQSPYGCYDMVGNVREWTTTLWDMGSDQLYGYPWTQDGRDDLQAPQTTGRVFRGGRVRNLVDFRSSLRRGHPPTDNGPKRNRHGFRVVKNK